VNALCPETDNLNYGGMMGTNLWVVPTKNSNVYDISTDIEPYKSNVITIKFVTETFNTQDYIDYVDHVGYGVARFKRYLLDDETEVAQYQTSDNGRNRMSAQISLESHEVQIWSEARFLDMSVLDGVKEPNSFPYFVSKLNMSVLDPHFTEVAYDNTFTDPNPNSYDLVHQPLF
jgi:hypothetical protein